jgi:hypothetical protein
MAAAMNGAEPSGKDNATCADAHLPPVAAPTKLSYLFTALIQLRFQPIADPRPPPDGGIIAWSQVLEAHFTVCNTWGYITTFGMFQSYYEQILPQSASTISWIGRAKVFLLFFIGPFSGRAADAGSSGRSGPQVQCSIWSAYS